MIEQMGFLLPIASWVLFASIKSIAVIPLVLLMRRLFAKWLTPQARYGLWFAVVACLTIPFGAQVDWRGIPQAVAEPVHVHADSRADAARHEEPVIAISAAPAAASFRPSLQIVAIATWLLGIAVLAAAVLRNAARYARISATAWESDAATVGLFEDCRHVVKARRQVRLLETAGIDSPVLVGYWRPMLLLPPNLSVQVNHEQLRLVLLHELTHVRRHDILVNWLITLVQIAHWFNPLVWYALRVARNDMEQACDAGVLRHLTTTEHCEYGNTLIRLSDIAPQRALLVQNASVVESRSQLKERINRIARFKPLGTGSSMLGAILIALISIIACTQGTDAPQQTAKPAVLAATAPVVEQAPVLPDSALLQAPKVDTGTAASKPKLAAAIQQETVGAPALETAYLQIKYASANDLAVLMKSLPGIHLLSVRGSIAVDERTNTLVIHDLPKNLTALRELVAQLDVPVEQVLIEGIIARVDNDLIQEMTKSAAPDGKSLHVTNFGLGRSALAALDAGQSANRAEVISKPHVIAKNHLQASISSGQVMPQLENADPGSPARKVGLSLKFLPVVQPDGHIAINIEIDYSQISGFVQIGAGGQKVPSIDKWQMATQLLMDSGGTAMLVIPQTDGRAGMTEQANSDHMRQLVTLITVRKLSNNLTSR